MIKKDKDLFYGVIGAGSFGTVIANLLAKNVQVLLYSRKAELVEKINRTKKHMGIAIHENVKATSDLEGLAQKCFTLFPIVPSNQFRAMMKELGPFLKPSHILIHGTKGLDIYSLKGEHIDFDQLKPEQVHTMTQVISQESVVTRMGCLSGPNLASEIIEGQPTATVVASQYEEVIRIGKKALTSPSFRVYGNSDLLGAELAGALKNIIAIGSGILGGKGLGKNIQAMLISRGLVEMVRFGQSFGSSISAFFGTAGVGDLIATATSNKSRNYTFGYRLGQGETFDEIQKTVPELAEGIHTLEVIQGLSNHLHLRAPITEMIYKVVFQNFNMDTAIRQLLAYPYDIDIDFL